MAYFDDPAHRENWENAMVGLRAERERRMAGEEPEAVESVRGFGQPEHAAHPERVPVSFEQLVEEDRLERTGRAPAPSMEKISDSLTYERVKDGPSRN